MQKGLTGLVFGRVEPWGGSFARANALLAPDGDEMVCRRGGILINSSQQLGRQPHRVTIQIVIIPQCNPKTAAGQESSHRACMDWMVGREKTRASRRSQWRNTCSFPYLAGACLASRPVPYLDHTPHRRAVVGMMGRVCVAGA